MSLFPTDEERRKQRSDRLKIIKEKKEGENKKKQKKSNYRRFMGLLGKFYRVTENITHNKNELILAGEIVKVINVQRHYRPLKIETVESGVIRRANVRPNQLKPVE